MNWQEILLRLLSVFLLIAINAFFVTTEFAIVSVRRSRINHLALAGDLQAQTVQSLQYSLDKLLSTTQLGITLSSLALGWIGESTMAVILQNAIASLPLSSTVRTTIAHSIAIPLAFILIVYLQIVLGELLPKSIALLYSEQLARFLAPASLVISSVFNPFILVLNQSTRCLLRCLGIKHTKQGWYKEVTPEELQLIINTEKELSGLEAQEKKLLNNVFEFGDVAAKEVMTPHIHIKALSRQTTCQQLLEEVAKTKLCRYPVQGESLDDIQGMVDLKDFAYLLAEGKITLESSIIELIKPIRFFDESMLLSELLPLMQRSRIKMAIMVDEYGSTSGLITRQDLIREIIGPELDSNFKKYTTVKEVDNKTFIVDAQINVEDLNNSLNLNLPIVDDYQTLGGFLLYQWQKIPLQGESLHFDDLTLTVTKANMNRLEEIKIYRHQKK